jgi:hypothetical protein
VVAHGVQIFKIRLFVRIGRDHMVAFRLTDLNRRQT